MKPFDFVNSINHKKNNMMRDTENDELAESSYVPFLTNRSLSYFPDTLFYANQMNILHNADNKLQYEYLLNSISPKKRFAKWVKAEDNDDLEMVKMFQYVLMLQQMNFTTVKANIQLNLIINQ